MHYDLIIFDCDGTLVDSETLYNTITSELLNEMGYPEYTPMLCVELFGGRSWTDIRLILEDRHQVKMPHDIVRSYADIANSRMDAELKVVEHALETVHHLYNKIKICVASNGERGNILKSLKIAKLDPYFPEHIVFSKIQVPRAKPFPDLFLYAANIMNVDPAKTLVIEDSVAGVQAGIAAGMDVAGFIGTAHDKEAHIMALTGAGAHRILDSFIHIPDALTHGKDWLK